jgi:hypothetical protein
MLAASGWLYVFEQRRRMGICRSIRIRTRLRYSLSSSVGDWRSRRRQVQVEQTFAAQSRRRSVAGRLNNVCRRKRQTNGGSATLPDVWISAGLRKSRTLPTRLIPWPNALEHREQELSEAKEVAEEAAARITTIFVQAMLLPD